MNCPVIHIVKRFGRVGGMETYVWHLVHGLAGQGVEVVIVCEQICEQPEENIRMIQVEASPERPRWKSMITFRARVDQTIREEFRGQTALIHSHERALCHQVTTFHGPPIESPKWFGWLSWLNRRVSAWQDMERDELLRPNVQMILPVSSQVRGTLMVRYPEIGRKRIELAWPGVKTPTAVNVQKRDLKQLKGLRFGFVGREWRRKGLDIAVRVVEEFRKVSPDSTLTVFGVSSDELPRAMRQSDWIIARGWVAEVAWSEFDLLLHPARKEPFGMVVPEARTHGIPVVMSSDVGAADLEFSETQVVDVNASVSEWCVAVKKVVNKASGTSEVKWTWDDLVNRHLRTIYPCVEAVTL